MPRLACLLPFIFAALAASALAPPAPETLDASAVADPVENELLVRLVRLGLTRDRSSKPEDAARLVCVRDRYPGSRRVRLRCATNADWEALAAISIARSQGNSIDKRETITYGPGVGMKSDLVNMRSFGGDAKEGVLDVSPNLLTNPVGEHDSHEANLTRIQVLRAMYVVAEMPDRSGTSMQDVVRFARAFSVVRRSGDDLEVAANAISTAALTLESYNEMVGLLEREPQFRARVNAALDSLAAPVLF